MIHKYNTDGPPWVCSCGWVYARKGVPILSNKPPSNCPRNSQPVISDILTVSEKENIIRDTTLFNLFKRYLFARSQWKKAKEPLRSPEEIVYIYDEICSKCPKFNTSTHWFMKIFKFLQHSCSICGCRLKRKGRRLNKIAWLTEQCPDSPPKWLANVPNMKEWIEKNPPKKGGCGCSGKK